MPNERGPVGGGKYDGVKLTPTKRLKMIAKLLEEHDAYLLATDGPVTQQPTYLRRIYLLAIGPQKEAGTNYDSE